MNNLLNQLLGIIHTSHLYDLNGEYFHNLNFYMKDRKGKTIGANKYQAKTFGFESEKDMLGLSDFDIVCDEHAHIYRNNDHYIMESEKSKTLVEPLIQFGGKELTALSCKFPLRSKKNKVIGIIGLSIVLDEATLKADSQDKPLKRSDVLTPRQMDCLLYLTKGLTIKQIASSLKLSFKTVENYIAEIKARLNCHNRSELIKAALQIPYIRAYL